MLSFVVIGFNEAPLLAACLESVRAATLDGMEYELIYVDAGSSDASLEIAEQAGVDAVLGGDRRRRAAECRNLGLGHARGAYVQFLDGDMALAPEWPQAALTVLSARPEMAAVCGILEERRHDVFFRALQIDWRAPEGEALYCGGAAMFRSETLRAVGGFPEDVQYGEEPLLCWRLRNEHGKRIWHLHQRMAGHDLAFRGFRDYWRRNVRVGKTYAEIAERLRGTSEPMWRVEVLNTLFWAMMTLVLCSVLFLGGATVFARPLALGLLLGVPLRKAVQVRQRGEVWPVALVYGFHTYLAKLGAAQGILLWHLGPGPNADRHPTDNPH